MNNGNGVNIIKIININPGDLKPDDDFHSTFNWLALARPFGGFSIILALINIFIYFVTKKKQKNSYLIISIISMIVSGLGNGSTAIPIGGLEKDGNFIGGYDNAEQFLIFILCAIPFIIQIIIFILLIRNIINYKKKEENPKCQE